MKHFINLTFFLTVIVSKGQFSESSVADSLYLLGNYTEAINLYAKVGDEKSSLQIARAYNAIGNKRKDML